MGEHEISKQPEDYNGSIGDSARFSIEAIDQQVVKIGINKKSWNTNLRLSENNFASRESSRNYQWNIFYNRQFTQSEIYTSTLLQMICEDSYNEENNRIELRITAEKDLFQDLFKSNLKEQIIGLILVGKAGYFSE